MGRLRLLRANWPVVVMVLLVALWLRYAFGPTLAGHEVWEDRTVAVRLTPSAHPNQMVYEDERVRISIGYDDFCDYLWEQILLWDYTPQEQARQVQYLAEWQEQVTASFAAGQSYPLGAHRNDKLLLPQCWSRGKLSSWTSAATGQFTRSAFGAGLAAQMVGKLTRRRTFSFPLSPFLLDDPRFFEIDSFYS